MIIKIINILGIILITTMGIWNIRSLIFKWKANPKLWIDFLVGIVIWCIAIGVLIYISITTVFI